MNENDCYDNNNLSKEINDLAKEIKSSKSFESYFRPEELYCKNLCINLKKSLSLSIDDYTISYDNNYIPPDEHGLKNSEPIIQNYYFTNKKKIESIDYYKIIKDDIRNFRKLNDYQMNYIKNNLSENEKNEIFDEFNKVLESIQNIL